jgi:hypothetical protein
MGIYLLIGFLGLICGFFSGLLGIGGGIIMAPLLLLIPPIIGLKPLSMHIVAGLTMVQALAACISGTIVHKKFNSVSGRLTVWMGSTIFFAALLGGAGSRWIPQQVLLFIFGLLALLAAFLMLKPVPEEIESAADAEFTFSLWRAILTAAGIGVLGGLVGQGGSFILIPLMISFIHIPVRIAIGSNLAIVLLSSSAGFLGKAVTGQIFWPYTIPIILTVVPAAQVGGILSHRVPVAKLRKILGLLIVFAAIRIFIAVFSG